MSIFNAVPVLRRSSREPCGNTLDGQELHRGLFRVESAPKAKGDKEKEKGKGLGWHQWRVCWSFGQWYNCGQALSSLLSLRLQKSLSVRVIVHIDSSKQQICYIYTSETSERQSDSTYLFFPATECNLINIHELKQQNMIYPQSWKYWQINFDTDLTNLHSLKSLSNINCIALSQLLQKSLSVRVIVYILILSSNIYATYMHFRNIGASEW